MTYYKATRIDGTDFYSGTVDYAGALDSGEPVTKPEVVNPRCCTSDVLHASTVPTETLIGGSWPCRLFEVEGDPVADQGCKCGFFSLTVLREVDAHDALGPQGRYVAALVECAKSLTYREAQRLVAARVAARVAAWDAAWDAARVAAWDAAWDAARAAARDAARAAARAAAWDAAGAAAGAAAWDAAWALVIRDLIGQHGFTQSHYDTLSGPWRRVIGRIHPDDEEMS